ncbi:iron uptake transporter deferrochelatase/peroxidase subunit [Aeromicrobium sp. Leaf350]|uniref:iron uptake transporter deferrochelatase/peroxidase subunit n=1 Tax=Aeromicrobium sp. Leaf350 TaxID=2876565 RepID=UPI001E474086|nr:iron uptake transporter deferrochelatase/peroxidase subunit [Aeromicrobium sp. Leaf350]
MSDPTSPEGTPARGVSRRGALGMAALAAAGTAAGFGAGRATAARVDDPSSQTYAFRGEHQAGITTPVQQHLYFASLDMTAGADRDDLISLLQDWTEAAEQLMAGREVGDTGAVDGSPLAPPDDTGEALGLGPHRLTLTFGLGPSLFDREGDPFGIADRRPEALTPLPLFAFDLLEEPISGGDLCIQACADDPQVVVHAIRNLSRMAFGRAQVRWTRLGYGRTSRTSAQQQTPRNLFGFKDGTANILSDDAEALDRWVWADDGWMAGGSYLVARTIQMTIESWDRTRLEEQELVVGRSKGEGAPLSGGTEMTEPDFEMQSSTGDFALPATSHVRLAHPDQNDGVQLLRRGYNYVDGNNDLGQITAGLFFLSFQRDPAQFVQVQSSLKTDALNEYIRHVGSALYAVPPGVRPGEHIAQGLFDA